MNGRRLVRELEDMGVLTEGSSLRLVPRETCAHMSLRVTISHPLYLP